jgi:hypothetical protein
MLVEMFQDCFALTYECTNVLFVFGPTAFYLAVGLNAFVKCKGSTKHWKLAVGLFLVLSGLFVTYDLLRAPGDHIFEVYIIKFKTLGALNNVGKTSTMWWYFCKDFLNPLVLVMLTMLMVKDVVMMKSKSHSK